MRKAAFEDYSTIKVFCFLFLLDTAQPVKTLSYFPLFPQVSPGVQNFMRTPSIQPCVVNLAPRQNQFSIRALRPKSPSNREIIVTELRFNFLIHATAPYQSRQSINRRNQTYEGMNVNHMSIGLCYRHTQMRPPFVFTRLYAVYNVEYVNERSLYSLKSCLGKLRHVGLRLGLLKA